MSDARLKHYGWGREDEGMTAEEQAFVLGRYHAKFARDAFETKAVPRLEDLALRAPRVALPSLTCRFLYERTLRPGRAHLRQILSGLRASHARRLR